MAILVLGATGFVGRAIVGALVEAGEEVRSAARHPRADPHPSSRDEGSPGASGASSAKRGRATSVRCDLRDPQTLPAALEGVGCAYYLVHSMGDGRPDFRAVERECARNFAKAAVESGCGRIVYLGGVSPHRRAHASEHLASRLEVGEILRASGIPTVELRAAMIIGEGSISWKIVRDLAFRLPLMVLPRWLESRTRPVAIADVVAGLLAARRLPIDAVDGSAWFDIPGPEVMSAREILRRVALLRGRQIPMLSVPLLTPRLSALWLKLVTGADYGIARELVLGLSEDLLPRDARYWRMTGHEQLQSFDEAAAIALEAERIQARASRPAMRVRDAHAS
jgi:uncharacterized protein YbjT (DUF2867 family)